ncbi:hypothetical protein SmJEL517_g06220 [Synchytrium microbalum]|uniref:Beta-glucuronidase n=1 Tax=Synchytrium microbalum TaxID=1806994 RepID=A0A507BWD1_9FUNG|nr:uncharacterized protein SmJEL517_g06220 [Synchytrium microbalum]TPX30154.1 hypothetical protein SmJEL517_g06220 [Synchytrium microbalum]
MVQDRHSYRKRVRIRLSQLPPKTLVVTILLLLSYICTTNAMTIHVSFAGAGPAPPGLSPNISRTIPTDFVGFSFAWGDFQAVFAKDDGTLNVQVLRLLQNLADSAGPPGMSIGGPSSELVWYNSSVLPRPAAATVNMTSKSIQIVDRVATAAGVRILTGITMLSSTRTASVELARDGILANVALSNLAGLELGSEPENWVALGYRPATWNYNPDYLAEYVSLASDIEATLPTVPMPLFAGPSARDPNDVLPFLANNSTMNTTRLVTFHKYALSACADNESPDLSPTGLLADPPDAGYPYLASMVSSKANIVVSQAGPVECANLDAASSVGTESFSVGLWALDLMLYLAWAGVRGIRFGGGALVNGTSITGNIGRGAPFIVRNTTSGLNAEVRPMYLAMLAFNRVLGNTGAAVVLKPSSSDATNNAVKIWAVANHQAARGAVIIIHRDPDGSPITVSFTLGATSPISDTGTGRVEVLAPIPGAPANSSGTLANQKFDGSCDGRPVGQYLAQVLGGNNGAYQVTLQPGTAAIIYLGGGNFDLTYPIESGKTCGNDAGSGVGSASTVGGGGFTSASTRLHLQHIILTILVYDCKK